MKALRVLMCGSVLSVKGGMVSVVKNYLNYEDWGNVNITYIPTHIEKSNYLLIPYFGIACCKILLLAMFGKIDIAHLHTAERGSFYRKAFLVRLLKKFGIKTIMHHHGAEFELFYKNLSEKRKKDVRRVLELTDVNIVLSQKLVSMVKDKALTAHVEVLYNAVNSYTTNPYNMKARNILFLGRLGERKGIYDLLEVIKILDADIDKDIKFYLCGDGEVEEVKQRIKAMGIDERIAHVGWVDSVKKEKFMSESMINVLPSYNEGLPMTILETMAYGIPNISTSIASIPEVLHDGENGYLINPGDINMLAKCISLLINDSSLRECFSQRSYLLIKNSFSLDTKIAELKEIYKKLCC